MIINKPQITKETEKLCISARVEISNPGISLPDRLWFRLPREYEDYTSDRGDAFLCAMLPIAMALGEDVEIDGVVSPRLAFGIREYQAIQSAWWPKHLKPVQVNYRKLETTGTPRDGGAVGCAFSGGVDSFFSLWSHLPENEEIPEYRVTHCLIINGFQRDMDLDSMGYFENLRLAYDPFLQDLGMKLLTVSTNLQKFRIAAEGARNLHHASGSVIAAAAEVFGYFFSRFYIPASDQYASLVPHGSHPLLDRLLGTESMEIIHDGGSESRLEKLRAITKWPETCTRLRVCFRRTRFHEKTGSIQNCGTCEKCIRTMVPLDVLGVLSNYETFTRPLERKLIRKTMQSETCEVYARENLKLAREAGRRDVAFDLRYSIVRSQILRATGKPIFDRHPELIQGISRELRKRGIMEELEVLDADPYGSAFRDVL